MENVYVITMTARWLPYVIALIVGVAAGLLAHSGVVAGATAAVFALLWLGINHERSN